MLPAAAKVQDGYFVSVGDPPKKMIGRLHKVDLPHVRDRQSQEGTWSAVVEVAGGWTTRSRHISEQAQRMGRRSSAVPSPRVGASAAVVSVQGPSFAHAVRGEVGCCVAGDPRRVSAAPLTVQRQIVGSITEQLGNPGSEGRFAMLGPTKGLHTDRPRPKAATPDRHEFDVVSDRCRIVGR